MLEIEYYIKNKTIVNNYMKLGEFNKNINIEEKKNIINCINYIKDNMKHIECNIILYYNAPNVKLYEPIKFDTFVELNDNSKYNCIININKGVKIFKYKNYYILNSDTEIFPYASLLYNNEVIFHCYI